MINLARRRDRLNAMVAQMKRLGLSFERIPAFDAHDVGDGFLAAHFSPSGPLGTIPKGDQCCSLSHRRAWSAFLLSGDTHAVILEDDVVLDAAASALLRDDSWIPDDVDVLKLEHFGPARQRVLVGAAREILPGRRIARIHSRHTGAAAYIMSRRAVRQLLSVQAKWSVPVDHLLFNPNVSPTAIALRPCQILPAIARQTAWLGGTSDIRRYRLQQRKIGLSLVRRELVRAYYELRLLPQQIGRVLLGRGALVCVGAKEFKAPHAVQPTATAPELGIVRLGRLR